MKMLDKYAPCKDEDVKMAILLACMNSLDKCSNGWAVFKGKTLIVGFDTGFCTIADMPEYMFQIVLDIASKYRKRIMFADSKELMKEVPESIYNNCIHADIKQNVKESRFRQNIIGNK